MLSLLLGAALAAEVTIDDQGAVVGTLVTPVPVDTLRARLADPTWLPTVSQDGTQVAIAAREGDCVVLDSVSPSVITVRYRTRQCPTADGFTYTLVQSDNFSAYAASWTFAATPAGTRATYRVAVTSTLWLPDAIVRHATKSGIAQMVGRLEAWRP